MAEQETLTTAVTFESVLKALGLIIAAFIAAYLIRRLIEPRLIKVLPRHIADLSTKIVFYSILFLGLVSVLGVLGVNVSGLLVAGGIAGIIIGFASQTVVSNFLSGLFLYIDKPFSVGDPVMIGDIGGVVDEITVFSTRIRQWDGVRTRIPNDQVFKSTIRSLSMKPVRRVEYRVSIAYSEDIDKAAKVIMDIIKREPLALVKPEPMVFVENLGDNGVILNVRFWAPSPQWFAAYSRVLGEIKKALDSAGIEIPFPQRVVWFRNELNVKGSTQGS
ncbi:MAG: mechanosensitive ion channel family protein [Desulfurococcales archaeon]|nr:mechanosensitive ion channel family protein [Desulfurococcales archaeon]